MSLREKLINNGIHLNDDVNNKVGIVDHGYDYEENESYVPVNK